MSRFTPRFFPSTKVSSWAGGSFGSDAVAGAGLITATGGDDDGTYGDWKWHKFNNTGAFTVTEGIGQVEIFMVGGGGGGGMYSGGGGGGAGIYEFKTVVHTAGGNGSGVYTITVGNGGDGNSYFGARGGYSIWADGSNEKWYVCGGGGGGGYLWSQGHPGFTGGGSAMSATSSYITHQGIGYSWTSATAGRGDNGGKGDGSGPWGGAGGGGGGMAGDPYHGSAGSAGGAGQSAQAFSYDNVSTYYGGGGGGGAYNATGGAAGANSSAGAGGTHSGNIPGTPMNGANATANRGGGGGGGGAAAGGGNGGKGIVIIRYATA